jgi:hypothetical protein
MAMPEGSLGWHDEIADLFMLWTVEGPDDTAGQTRQCRSPVELANLAYELYLRRGSAIEKPRLHSD